MDFTCCWKTQPCPTPCTLHTQALSPSGRAQPRERGAGSCPAAPSVSASPCAGPRRLHLSGRTGHLMSCWKEAFWLSRHLCSSLLGCWAHAGVSARTASRPHLYQLEISHWEPDAVSRDPGNFPVTSILLLVAEIQETIKILMRSREDFK